MENKTQVNDQEMEENFKIENQRKNDSTSDNTNKKYGTHFLLVLAS